MGEQRAHYTSSADCLTRSRRRFDAITVDPSDPGAKGSAYLQTRELFEQAKNRLNPGGVLTLWLPLYENDEAAVKSAIATFFDAFPNGVVRGNTLGGEGYDLVLMGQAGPTVLDIDALQARIDSPGFEDVKRSLAEIGMGSIVDLLARFAGSAEQLAPWLKDAEINRDANLKLQYLAGLDLNRFESGAIYGEMLDHVAFPVEVFTGAPSSVAVVREALEQAIKQTRGADRSSAPRQR